MTSTSARPQKKNFLKSLWGFGVVQFYGGHHASVSLLRCILCAGALSLLRCICVLMPLIDADSGTPPGPPRKVQGIPEGPRRKPQEGPPWTPRVGQAKGRRDHGARRGDTGGPGAVQWSTEKSSCGPTEKKSCRASIARAVVKYFARH